MRRLLQPAEAAQQGQQATPPSTDAHPAAPAAAAAEIIRPIQNGVVQDWDALEALLAYVLYDEVGAGLGLGENFFVL